MFKVHGDQTYFPFADWVPDDIRHCIIFWQLLRPCFNREKGDSIYHSIWWHCPHSGMVDSSTLMLHNRHFYFAHCVTFLFSYTVYKKVMLSHDFVKIFCLLYLLK